MRQSVRIKCSVLVEGASSGHHFANSATIEVCTCFDHAIEFSVADSELPDLRELLASAASVVSRILPPSRRSWKRHSQHDVGTREQRLVDGLREVAGRDEQHVWATVGEVVELGKYCIRCAMNIDWIGIHAQPRPIDGERLDLVEQHDQRMCGGAFRDRGTEQLRYGLLALPERRARERVRINLQIEKLPNPGDDSGGCCSPDHGPATFFLSLEAQRAR